MELAIFIKNVYTGILTPGEFKKYYPYTGKLEE
jgi:hypothetical protein